MPIINIVGQQKGFDKALQNQANFKAVAAQENKAAMDKAINFVKGEAKKNAPVGATAFLQSKVAGAVVKVSGTHVRGVAGDYAPYARPVEKGAKAHWPNMKNLQYWVKRKIGIKNKAELEAVTFLIGRKLSKKRYKKQPFLRPAFLDNKDQVNRFFKQALANIVKRLRQ